LVNESTRNFNLQATVQNQDGRLRPGMFAQTRVTLKQEEAVITLPQTAVTHDPYGDSVFIIVDGGKDERGQSKLTVTRTFVIAGKTRGDQIAIAKGLKAGDMVVTTGQLKLKEGAPVVVDNRVQPTNNPAPVPEQDR
jgi:membrane fusion protein (multidrug efflux system)